MSKKMGRPPMAKDEVRGKFISTRLSPPEYEAIESAVAKSDSQKTEWLREAAIQEAQDPVPKVNCKFTAKELNKQQVEFTFHESNRAETWMGTLLARTATAGKLKIELCITIQATLARAVVRRLWLTQYAANRIERHPDPQIAVFRLIV
jgi:hypothetical protein